VPGVAAVNSIHLFSHPTANQFRLIPAQNGRATLSLSGWQLPELLKVVAVSGNAPTSLAPDTTPTDGGDGIAVPVVPETC
jgi:hypothetical protein